MKPKNFIIISLVIAIVCFGTWWLMRPKATKPAKTAVAPMPAKADAFALSKVEAPKRLAPPTIAPPGNLLAPLPDIAPIAATQPTAALSPVPDSKSLVELDATIAKIANFYREGDLLGYYQYITQPDKIDFNRLQQLQNSKQQNDDLAAQVPYWREEMLKDFMPFAKAYEDLETQIPTFNSDGNEATYVFTIEDEDPHPMTFVKINGRWFAK